MKIIFAVALMLLPAVAFGEDISADPNHTVIVQGSGGSSSSSSGGGGSTSGSSSGSAGGLGGGAGGSNCQAQEQLVNQARDKVNSVPTNTPGYAQLVTAVKTQVAQFGKAGCNFSGDNIPKMGTENHQTMDAYQTPASPGDKSLPIDTSFLKGFVQTKTDDMPKTMDSSYTPTFTNTLTAATSPTAASSHVCGTIAAAYGSYASTLTGSQQLTYKEGCSATDLAGQTAAGCQANQIGKFGLVQAAYNNSQQAVSTSDLASLTPASSTTGNTVAFYDKTTGQKNEPNGCRLTSYASCGQAGDIIMVQAATNATDSSTFDSYLIYDGKGGFYYVLPNSTPAVKHGALPADYANASYAATRLGCATAPTTTAGQ